MPPGSRGHWAVLKDPPGRAGGVVFLCPFGRNSRAGERAWFGVLVLSINVMAVKGRQLCFSNANINLI